MAKTSGRKGTPAKPATTPKPTVKPAVAKSTTTKPAAVPDTAPNLSLPAFFNRTGLQSLLIFAFAFLLYANTLGHGFTQDDAIVITDNMFTTQGVKGIPGILQKDTFFGFFKVEGKAQLVSGGRYRPLTLVLFALVHQLFGANTFVFHLLTVLLFAAACVVLYHTLRQLLLPRGEGYANLIAWMAAMLFAVHPIHIEAVANIKGSDESVTLLGSLGALWLTLRAYDTGKAWWGALAAGVFFLGCLAKENAATFVVIIPMALWFFRAGGIGKALQHSLPVWGAFLAFFILRGVVMQWKFGAPVPDLMNNPFLKIAGNAWVPFSPAERLATIIYTLGLYVKLLFIPHPLTHDYYPRHIDLMHFGRPGVLLSLALYIGLVVIAVRGMAQRSIISFGIWFYLLALSIVSNLVFPVGTNMGERFAFMPSVGFCLVIAALLARLVRPAETSSAPASLNLPLGILGAVVLLFSVKTITRNTVWASNDLLFLTDVATSPNSAKIRNACAGALFDQADRETDEAKRQELYRRSLEHATKGLEIYPNYSDILMTRGGCHFHLKNFEAAVADYRLADQLNGSDKTKNNLAIALREAGKYFGEQKNDLNKALQYLNESWKINPKDDAVARLLGVATGMQGNNAEALTWFQKAVDLAPNNASHLFDLGTAYYLVGNAAQGEALRQKAIQMEPALGKK
jgi:protein O-mannosyl-transferase